MNTTKNNVMLYSENKKMVAKDKKKPNLLCWVPLAILVLGFFLFFYFHLYRYITLENIKNNRHLLVRWTHENYTLAAISYFIIYTLIIAISIPGALVFTIAAGFLFGTLWGTIFVLLSETVGSALLFFAIQISLSSWFEKKAGKWIKKMEINFQKNAFNYIITLRLIPIIPFWAVNIAAALVGVELTTFMIATFIGIIPLTIIYVSLGQSLGLMFDTQQTPDLTIVFQPHILLPLLGLTLLSVMPAIYHYFQKRKP